MTTGSEVINNFKIISSLKKNAHTDAVNIQYSHTSGAPADMRARFDLFWVCKNADKLRWFVLSFVLFL